MALTRIVVVSEILLLMIVVMVVVVTVGRMAGRWNWASHAISAVECRKRRWPWRRRWRRSRSVVIMATLVDVVAGIERMLILVMTGQHVTVVMVMMMMVEMLMMMRLLGRHAHLLATSSCR